MQEVRATIVVPTHNHNLTLPITVKSALEQSIKETEIIIIGDGVTEETRTAAKSLVANDNRVIFMDLPKGENHGETYRDLAIRKARSEFIFYLCDDDLLMGNHVANLLTLLESHDFVQSKNGFLATSGELILFPIDLAAKGALEWHLKTPNRNLVSLTGTAHRKSTYLELNTPWSTTPEGEWPDHFMWKKFFRAKGLRAATHAEMTALQFPTSEGRQRYSQSERVKELKNWENVIARAEAPNEIRYLVYRSALRRLAQLLLRPLPVRTLGRGEIKTKSIGRSSLRNRISNIVFKVLVRIYIDVEVLSKPYVHSY